MSGWVKSPVELVLVEDSWRKQKPHRPHFEQLNPLFSQSRNCRRQGSGLVWWGSHSCDPMGWNMGTVLIGGTSVLVGCILRQTGSFVCVFGVLFPNRILGPP